MPGLGLLVAPPEAVDFRAEWCIVLLAAVVHTSPADARALRGLHCIVELCDNSPRLRANLLNSLSRPMAPVTDWSLQRGTLLVLLPRLLAAALVAPKNPTCSGCTPVATH